MSFNDIINQKKAKDIISGQLKSGKIPHAYLFMGPGGVGRKKTALEMAKALNCTSTTASPASDPCDSCVSCSKIERGIHPDIQIIDFLWQSRLENKALEKQRYIKIDTIRALQKDINLRPTEAVWKVFIIEPAEKITLDAANCLLKTLEEPPERTVLILLALHKDNLPATVVSRTQIINFSPLSEDEVASFLMQNFSVGKHEAREAAKVSEGSLSAAIQRSQEDYQEIKEVWQKIKSSSLSTAEVLSISQIFSKTSAEFLSELLIQAKSDFRSDPVHFRSAIDSIISSQRLIERNINPQMTLDVLLLKLSGSL